MDSDKILDFIGYPNYSIDKNGVVKNLLTGKFKVNSLCRNTGYYKVYLYNGGAETNMSIHRLLALAFIPNPNNKRTVNHINGIKTDNRLENLEWATDGENLKHAFRIGLKKVAPQLLVTGKDHWSSKKVRMLDKDTGKIIREFDSLTLAANHVGQRTTANIAACCYGRIKTSMGYKWQHV